MSWRRPRGGYESGGPVPELPRVGAPWRDPRMPTTGTTQGSGQARAHPGQVEPDVPVRAPLPPDPPAVSPHNLPERRPHPAANAWPDDAVTVTYSELRRLVALHLDHAWQGMPHTEPWAWVRLRAGAIRDGEAPLLLSEVMEP